MGGYCKLKLRPPAQFGPPSELILSQPEEEIGMSTKMKALLGVAVLWCLGGGVGTPAFADDHEDQAEMQALISAGKFISPEEARTKALAAKPGTVTDVDLERSWRSDYHYEVEIVDRDLQKWEVHIDAKTGKVGSIKRDWFD
jgi:hypothetical protein